MNKSSQYRERIFSLMCKHPYLCAFIACIIVHIFTFASFKNMPENTRLISTMLISILLVYVVFRFYNPTTHKRVLKPLIATACVAFVLLLSALYNVSSGFEGVYHYIGGFLIVFFVCLFLRKAESKEKLNSLFIIAFGFVVKFYYIFMTSIWTRQHDVGSFEGFKGHTGYIQYLLVNHGLPDFDVRTVWQFYHPPLHHIISATWIDINETIFGLSTDNARESIQILTLFYSMVIVITVYKILKHLGLKGISLYVPLILISFHPSFILLSGSINNDILSIALILLAVLFTLRWIQEQSIDGAIKIALCVGFAMMTKISSAIVAIPIAIIFLIALIKKKGHRLGLIRQYATVGIISAPLGLGYQLRSYIKWDVPLLYVQELGKDIDQYLGEGNFLERITNFSLYQFKSVFLQWERTGSDGIKLGYNESNPLIALMKTALFEESVDERYFPQGSFLNFIATAFFWLSVLLAAFALVAMIIMCIRKCSMTALEKVFFASFWLITMISYYKMAYDYPFVCTISFRYVTPVIVIGIIFIGMLIDKMKPRDEGKAKILSRVYLSASLLFAVLSTICYITISGI